MEINIKKVDNGYVVEYQNETDVDSIFQTYVFTRYSQVVKFLKEHLNSKGE
jgi:hypothetical protein